VPTCAQRPANVHVVFFIYLHKLHM